MLCVFQTGASICLVTTTRRVALLPTVRAAMNFTGWQEVVVLLLLLVVVVVELHPLFSF